jgi:hypothetical protein
VLVLAAAMPARAASRLSDEYIPLDTSLNDRPVPPIELGDKFLETGQLSQGIELPTGAVWQPAFMVFGLARSAVQTFDNGLNPRVSEWANQLSVYGNLQLTGTERFVIGFRPLDDNGRVGTFFGQEMEPRSRFHKSLYGTPTTFFFEGDFSEIFPKLDPNDRHALDYGLSVGRQPLLLQDGLFLDDTVDSFGLIRNTILSRYWSPMRVTGFIAWNHIHRNDNKLDETARFAAFDASMDHYDLGTFDLDGAYLNASDKTGSAVYGAGSVTNRVVLVGRSFNLTFRANGSYALDHETKATGSGVLLLGELSRTLEGSDNFAYLDSFFGFGHYSSVARRPDGGGPLGRVGILYEALGMNRYGTALSDQPTPDSIGLSLGYQMFFDGARRQVVIEAGGRTHKDAIALGGRLQQALGKHTIIQFDTFVAGQEARSVGAGARTEVMFKF